MNCQEPREKKTEMTVTPEWSVQAPASGDPSMRDLFGWVWPHTQSEAAAWMGGSSSTGLSPQTTYGQAENQSPRENPGGPWTTGITPVLLNSASEAQPETEARSQADRAHQSSIGPRAVDLIDVPLASSHFTFAQRTSLSMEGALVKTDEDMMEAHDTACVTGHQKQTTRLPSSTRSVSEPLIEPIDGSPTRYSCALGPSAPTLSLKYWVEHKTTVFHLDVRGIIISRRRDDNMVNGTKLLNLVMALSKDATGQTASPVKRIETRGQRDSILKKAKERAVVKSGQMAYKGVWITLDCARRLANDYGIGHLLHPILQENPQVSVPSHTCEQGPWTLPYHVEQSRRRSSPSSHVMKSVGNDPNRPTGLPGSHSFPTSNANIKSEGLLPGLLPSFIPSPGDLRGSQSSLVQDRSGSSSFDGRNAGLSLLEPDHTTRRKNSSSTDRLASRHFVHPYMRPPGLQSPVCLQSDTSRAHHSAIQPINTSTGRQSLQPIYTPSPRSNPGANFQDTGGTSPVFSTDSSSCSNNRVNASPVLTGAPNESCSSPETLASWASQTTDALLYRLDRHMQMKGTSPEVEPPYSLAHSAPHHKLEFPVSTQASLSVHPLSEPEKVQAQPLAPKGQEDALTLLSSFQ